MGKLAPPRPVRAHPHGCRPDTGRRWSAKRTIGAFGSRRDAERPMLRGMDVRRGIRTIGAALASAALGLGLVVATASAAGAQTTTTTTTRASTTTTTRAAAPLPPVNTQGTLAWHDATRSASLAIGLDVGQIVPTAPLRVVFTWTFEGPTPLGTSGDSSNATSCDSVIGRTYTRTITDWRPVIYFGTSADVTAYRIGSNQLDGPWAAKATGTAGEGHETVTPVRCDGNTPIARTVRTYDVTYTTPEMPLARYALLTPDFGFPVWWQEGTPPVVEAVAPPFGSPATTATTAADGTTTTAAGATTTTAAGASTTTGATTTTTAPTSSTAASTTTTAATTTTVADTTTTTAAPAAGGTGSGTGPGTTGGGGDPSALDQARALVGALASFLAVVGLALAAWTLTPRAGRAVRPPRPPRALGGVAARAGDRRRLAVRGRLRRPHAPRRGGPGGQRARRRRSALAAQADDPRRPRPVGGRRPAPARRPVAVAPAGHR